METLIPLNIEPLEEGGYLATSDDLQGLSAQGRTIAETLEIAQDVARRLVESYIEHGVPLPKCFHAGVLVVGVPTKVQIAVSVSGVN